MYIGIADSPHVLLVEDDEPILAAVDFALRQEGYEVRAEADGVGIEAVWQEFRPDLAILDLRLRRGPDGYVIARRLREAGDVPVVFLTGADSEKSRLAGFDVGADDYIVKPFSMAELLARVKVVLRRTGKLRPTVWRVADLVVDEATGTATRCGEPLDLTATEFRLLYTLVGHRNQVMSKSQLLSLVWGFDYYDTNLVEVNVSALRRKLEARGPRLVHTVRGMGYRLKV